MGGLGSLTKKIQTEFLRRVDFYQWTHHPVNQWRLHAGVSHVSEDHAANASGIPTAYGESRIFCFNRVRIGMHASNAKRDSIQTFKI